PAMVKTMGLLRWPPWLRVPPDHSLRLAPRLEDAPAPRSAPAPGRPARQPLSPELTLIRPECYSTFDGLKNTAIQPVKQLGKTLFAPSGTKMRLLLASAATECAVLAGCAPIPVTAGTLNVGAS